MAPHIVGFTTRLGREFPFGAKASRIASGYWDYRDRSVRADGFWVSRKGFLEKGGSGWAKIRVQNCFGGSCNKGSSILGYC